MVSIYFQQEGDAYEFGYTVDDTDAHYAHAEASFPHQTVRICLNASFDTFRTK